LGRGAASVIYGESNVGKTFFALDLAMHVAAARPWHGHLVPTGEGHAGKVVYMACEGGSGIRNRVEALRLEHPELMDQAEQDGDFLLLPTSVDLHGPGDAAALQKVFQDVGRIGLIVIDTLARAMGTGDENTTKDMGAFIANVDKLRHETGAHVMIVHHSGKDASKGARGSGSLRAAVDTEIELARNGSVIMAETRKQRDMLADKTFAYLLQDVDLGNDEDGDKITSAVVVPTEPVKPLPRLTGQQKIALQALDDAIAHRGEKKHSDMFPANRRLVTLECWREYCDRHSLSSGESSSAKRKAFFSVKNSLQEKEVVRVVDDHVWRCGE
jgi:hypothetical protein